MDNMIARFINEPRREKTCLRSLRPGQTQISTVQSQKLHRSLLETSDTESIHCTNLGSKRILNKNKS